MTTAHEKMPPTIDFADADFTAASHVNKRTLLSDEAILNIARASLKRGEVLKQLLRYVAHKPNCTTAVDVSTCDCGLRKTLVDAEQMK